MSQQVEETETSRRWRESFSDGASPHYGSRSPGERCLTCCLLHVGGLSHPCPIGRCARVELEKGATE